MLRQKGPTARTPNGGCGGGAAKNESIIIVRIGSSLHIDCHYTYYIIFCRHRASPLAVFPHELIPCARVLDTVLSTSAYYHIIWRYTRTDVLFLQINRRLDEYIFLLLFFPLKIDGSFSRIKNNNIKYHIIYSVHIIIVRVSLPLVVCDRWPCDLHALETDRYTRATRIIIIMCIIT